MRGWLTRIGVVALAAVLGACGGASASSVSAFVLEPSDLDDGWSSYPYDDEMSSEEDDGLTCDNGTTLVLFGGELLAERYYASDDERFLVSDVREFDTEEDAEAELARFEAGYDDCPSTTGQVTGAGTTARHERLATVALGDGSSAFSTSWTTDDGVGYVLIEVTVQYGNRLATVAIGGSQSISLSDVESMASRVQEKVGG